MDISYRKRNGTTAVEVVSVEYLLRRSQRQRQLQISDLKKEDEDDEEEGSMVLDLGHRFRRFEAPSPLLSQKPQPLFSPRSLHPPH